MSCGVGRRCGSDPALLWLWCRSAVVAPIGPLAWEPLYAEGAALKSKKPNKRKQKKKGKCAKAQRQSLNFCKDRISVHLRCKKQCDLRVELSRGALVLPDPQSPLFVV